MQIALKGHAFTLLHEKALWKEDEAILIIADIHLGKASHFRKEGIPIPLQSQLSDYDNLRNLFNKTRAKKVYFLGDLFHSSFNKDWAHFEQLVCEFTGIAFTLIKGNHDIIDNELFSGLGVNVIDTYLEDRHFIYSHEPVSFTHEKLNIAGHIHPGISLSGIGRQSARLPCFYLSGNVFLLPAFGILTGLYSIPYSNAEIYAVLQGEIRKI